MITLNPKLVDRAASIGVLLQSYTWRLGTAESCTGGLIAGILTAVPGSSAWFLGGIVTYDNTLKNSLLGVPNSLLATAGAVSKPVAIAMAVGARTRLGVEASIAVSGIAGPTGGTAKKPIGTVWIAWSVDNNTQAKHFQFPGSRHAVRIATITTALNGLITLLEAKPA